MGTLPKLILLRHLRVSLASLKRKEIDKIAVWRRSRNREGRERHQVTGHLWRCHQHKSLVKVPAYIWVQHLLLSTNLYFISKDTVMMAPPKININTKSAVRPRNEPSSSILQYRYLKTVKEFSFLHI